LQYANNYPIVTSHQRNNAVVVITNEGNKMTIAKNLIDTFDGDFDNAVENHGAVRFSNGFAVFEDGSAIQGSDYGVEEIDAAIAIAAINQQ